MIVKPRVRGFICTTAHPVGCAAHVAGQVRHVAGRPALAGGPRNALVIGCSAGYGLASRISAAFGAGAATLGVSFEKAPTEKKTATAGWYNNRAFEAEAARAGRWARTLDGDAFSDELKAEAIETIRREMGPIDLVVYSLASPVRRDPETGETWRSAIKPIGETFHVKTLDVDHALVHEVDLEPATDEEIAATVKVMGGEDWERWMTQLAGAGVLAPDCRTVAYTYIGRSTGTRPSARRRRTSTVPRGRSRSSSRRAGALRTSPCSRPWSPRRAQRSPSCPSTRRSCSGS